jgi:hypothetical protein
VCFDVAVAGVNSFLRLRVGEADFRALSWGTGTVYLFLPTKIGANDLETPKNSDAAGFGEESLRGRARLISRNPASLKISGSSIPSQPTDKLRFEPTGELFDRQLSSDLKLVIMPLFSYSPTFATHFTAFECANVNILWDQVAVPSVLKSFYRSAGTLLHQTPAFMSPPSWLFEKIYDGGAG